MTSWALPFVLCIALVGCGGSESESEAPAEPVRTPSGEQRSQIQQFLDCLRDEGIDVPDDPGQARGAIDPSDPELQRAMQACHELRPQRPVSGG
jgi:hypothetical protein